MDGSTNSQYWIIDEQSALDKIKSNRSIQSHLNSFKSGMNKTNINHTILLNLTGNGHGCRNNCDYCNWRHHDLLRHCTIPDKKALKTFIEGFTGYKIYISGGGDPLFEYEKHYYEIENLIDNINSLGFLACLITREYDNAPLIADRCHQICLSADDRDHDVLRALENIRQTGKRVSVVYDSEMPISYYKEMYEFYEPYICFASDGIGVFLKIC